MKYIIFSFLFSFFLLGGCKKDSNIIPQASFSFRGDTASLFEMATYDTCTLINNSVNADSSFWDLGNGNISKEKNLVLTYSTSGTYIVKLTVMNNNGQRTSTIKKVKVLDRVLKKIIIKAVYWDTIPNQTPNFNAVWPTSSTADVFVQVQKYTGGDSILPYSGLMPNSPILYKSPTINNVSSKSTTPIVINVPGKFVVDKNMVLNKAFTINLIAKDSNNMIYSLQSSLESGVSFGIQQESFQNNTFILICNLFSSVEFDCDFE